MSDSQLNATYPHVNIDVQDNSGGSTIAAPVHPLHMPCFFIFAESGPIGTPYYGQYSDLVSMFGSQTWSASSSLYQHSTVFAKMAAQYQPIYVVRLADSTVTSASLVLEAIVTEQAIPQYVVDSLGAPVLNSSGLPTPQLQSDGVTHVTQPGISLQWQVRALASGETYDTIVTTTSSSGSVTTTTYPIIADIALYPGSATNRSGFSFYYTPNYDPNVVASINALTYRFAPVVLQAGNSGTTSFVYDSFGSNYNDVSLMATAIDSTTNQDVSLNAIIANNYSGTDSVGNSISLFDYNMHVYSNNVATLGAQIISLSPELPSTMSPHMINIMSAIDQNGYPYRHFVVTSGSAQVLNKNSILYHTGGADGTTTKASLDTLTGAYCQGTLSPEFADYFRHPFTHFYDSGYSLATKYQLMNLYSVRDDIKIDFSTQDVANLPNTAAQDESTGSAILAAALLYPESTLYGTDAMRGSIYQQCGVLVANAAAGYSGYIPLVLNRLVKRCQYNNADYIKGNPKGRPNSEVTLFSKVNWTEATFTQKQLNWNTALNTVSYCDMTTLFYSDLRSIYSDQTSLLSDDVFVDYLIYLKHLVRDRWTYYAGTETPIARLYTTIGNDIDTTCAKAFNGALPTKTTVYQTAKDLAVGYSCTVSVAVTGTMPNRVWNVIVPVSRAA